MKKNIIVLLLIVIFLTGCDEDIESSSTCTLTDNNGNVSIYKYKAKKDKINYIEFIMIFDNSIFDVDSLNILNEEQKETIKENVLNSLGFNDIIHDGVDIDLKINDQLYLIINIDLNVADLSVIKTIGLDFSNTNMSLNDTIIYMKNSGAVCE